MNILQVNYYDAFGGAARIASSLHNGYSNYGHHGWMAVGEKKTTDPQVFQIPLTLPPSAIGKTLFLLAQAIRKRKRFFGQLRSTEFMYQLADPRRSWNRWKGFEDFDFPGSRKILSLLSEKPDVLHLHNLHLNYFDLTYLPELSNQMPTIMTLHDMWSITGHCAHSMDCERWRTGCGKCPHLDTYPAMSHDQTAANWKRKQEIYSKSRLSIVAPSDWLLSKAKQSILAPAINHSKVIPNGIDLNTYYPRDKSFARNKLGLPMDAIILLFVSAGGGFSKDSFKDYSTIQKSIKIVVQKHKNQKLVFIALGKKSVFQKIENFEIRYLPYEKNPEEVANYYSAADIYLHASKAESFGLVIVEAQACGTPVIATAIGGVSEIILDGQTGLLTEPENPEDMAEKIMKLLNDKELRESIASTAMKKVKENYSLDAMVQNYLSFYEQVIDESRK